METLPELDYQEDENEFAEEAEEEKKGMCIYCNILE